MDVLIVIGSTAAFAYSILGMVLHPDQAANFLFFETGATIITLVLLGNMIEQRSVKPVSYTHLRAHETVLDLVCRLLLEKKKNITTC